MTPSSLLLLAALAADPQTPLPHGKDQVPWPPGTVAHAAIRRVEAGRLTFDGRPDVVTLIGKNLLFAYGPPHYRAFAKIEQGVADFCLLPEAASTRLDAIVTIGAAGLRAHWLKPDGGDFASQDILSGPAHLFSNVLRIEAGDLGGDGAPDLVGLAGDRLHFLRLDAPPGGGLPSVPAPGLVAPATVLDFKTALFDGDQRADLVCLTTIGVSVLNPKGQPAAVTLPLGPYGGAIATFRDPSSPTDRVVWVRRSPSPTGASLVVFDAGGAEVSQAMPDIDPVSVRAVDLNGDGWEDIVVRGRQTSQVLLGINRKANGNLTFPDKANTWFFVKPSAAPDFADSTLRASVAVGDRDGDGDADLFVPLLEPPVLACLENPTLDALAFVPRIGTVTYEAEDPARDDRGRAPQTPGGAGGQGQTSGYGGEEGGLGKIGGRGRVHLEVHLPPKLPTGATHLDLLVWRQERVGLETSQDAWTHLRIPLPASPADWPMTATFGVDERAFPFLAVFPVELSFVKIDAGGELARQFPGRQSALAVDDATEEILESEAPPNEPIVGVGLATGDGPGTPSSVEVGAFVPLVRIPDFGLDLVPRPDAQSGPPVGGQ